jgi:hypothetical protein
MPLKLLAGREELSSPSRKSFEPGVAGYSFAARNIRSRWPFMITVRKIIVSGYRQHLWIKELSPENRNVYIGPPYLK